MRRVGSSFLEPGMKIGRAVYNNEGKVLLASGVILTQYYISRLRDLGIGSVYIRGDDEFDVPSPPDVVSEQTRIESVQVIRESFNSLQANRNIDLRAVRATVDNLIDELLDNLDIMVNFTDIRSYDEYTFGHSVNVCILSLLTGIARGYHQLKLKELGIGALLHDIGKICIDKDIINKPGKLTAAEFEQIKRHPGFGFEILRSYPEVPLLSAHIAFQHHEHWDGRGYPRELPGEEIHEYARIVTAADVFDALTADRPYRAAYSIDQAVTIMNRMSGVHFEPRALVTLFANIAIIPVGSFVQLNSGEIGLVTAVNRDHPTRPVIKVVFDRKLKVLKNPHKIDLARLNTIYIQTVLSEVQVDKILKGTRRGDG